MEADDLTTRVARNPKYQELKAKRTRMGWWLTLAMMVVYYGFILLVAFDKPFLATRLGPHEWRHAHELPAWERDGLLGSDAGVLADFNREPCTRRSATSRARPAASEAWPRREGSHAEAAEERIAATHDGRRDRDELGGIGGPYMIVPITARTARVSETVCLMSAASCSHAPGRSSGSTPCSRPLAMPLGTTEPLRVEMPRSTAAAAEDEQEQQWRLPDRTRR